MSDLRSRELAAVDVATGRLLETVRDLGDLGAETWCAGWTRGHVLSHVARNADGLADAVEGVLHGPLTPVYRSDVGRDADIAAGSGRPLAELVADVQRSAARLADLLDEVPGSAGNMQVERTPGGQTFAIGAIPRMRLREVVYHHVDLRAGYGFADVDPDMVGQFLGDSLDRLRSHPQAPDVTVTTIDDGASWTVGRGTVHVSGARSGVLGWLARGIRSGVRAATGAVPVPLPAVPPGV